MVALRPAGPTFPRPDSLGDTAADQLLETYGSEELAQWSTAELWSTGYRLLHEHVLAFGFRRVKATEAAAPAATPEPATAEGPADHEASPAPPGGAPRLRLVGEGPEPRSPEAGPGEAGDGHPRAEAAPPLDGHWLRSHVQITIEGLPDAERRFLLTLLATDSGTTASRRSGWPQGGDASTLVAATRGLLQRIRTSIEQREAAYREEGLS